MQKSELVALESKNLVAPVVLLRDQCRALFAFKVVNEVPKDKRDNYKIAVNDLGANILRSGLAAAVAAIERLGDRGKILLKHLSQAGIPGLEEKNEINFAASVRQLDADHYILATRETLRVATWLKRAIQASYKDN
jgi:CRISPR-associated protein Cmr5